MRYSLENAVVVKSDCHDMSSSSCVLIVNHLDHKDLSIQLHAIAWEGDPGSLTLATCRDPRMSENSSHGTVSEHTMVTEFTNGSLILSAKIAMSKHQMTDHLSRSWSWPLPLKVT